MSDIRDEMINDSKDFLDTVEVTTIAQECVNLKKVEDDIAAIEEQLKKRYDVYSKADLIIKNDNINEIECSELILEKLSNYE